MLKPEPKGRGRNGLVGDLTIIFQARDKVEDLRMKLDENLATAPAFLRAEPVSWQKVSGITPSPASPTNLKEFAKPQLEDHHPESPAAKQAGDHLSERIAAGKYPPTDFRSIACRAQAVLRESMLPNPKSTLGSFHRQSPEEKKSRSSQ